MQISFALYVCEQLYTHPCRLRHMLFLPPNCANNSSLCCRSVSDILCTFKANDACSQWAVLQHAVKAHQLQVLLSTGDFIAMPLGPAEPSQVCLFCLSCL